MNWQDDDADSIRTDPTMSNRRNRRHTMPEIWGRDARLAFSEFSDSRSEMEIPLMPISSGKSLPDPPYHVFTRSQKKALVYIISLAGLFSPLSSNIYFPALDSIALVNQRPNCWKEGDLLTYVYLAIACVCVSGSFIDHHLHGCSGNCTIDMGTIV